MKIRNSVLKIGIAVFYILVLNIGYTRAFYSDSAVSTSNTFSASSLDLSLKNVDDSDITGDVVMAAGMVPGDSHSGSLKVVKEGILDFEYNITSEHRIGSLALFNALNVTVVIDGNVEYTGGLSTMSLISLPVITGGEDIVDITIFLPVSADPSLQLEKCAFDFVFRGDQLGSTVGFWDEERVRSSASTTDWTPPVISNLIIASSDDPNGLKITWNTDEEAKSYVELGTTTSYELGTFPSPGPYDHIVDLTNEVSLYTSYHFRIRAVDAFGNTSYSDDYEFEVELNWVDFHPRGSIVLNEILPNPIGLDNLLRPEGEWVELYNKGTSAVDVNGWSICSNSGCVTINSSRTNTGGTISAPGRFLVVYFDNLYSGGFLGNSGWNFVTLSRPGWFGLRDMHWYYGSQEGKSIVRYPDGGNLWFDPIPTPGEANVLDEIISEPSAPEATTSQGEVNSDE